MPKRASMTGYQSLTEDYQQQETSALTILPEERKQTN